MKYTEIVRAEFLARPNRFIAKALVDGEEKTVHVKNTGRCKELLIGGATVYLDRPTGKSRKTEYDLVAVEKKREGKSPLLINMDSQAPNSVAAEWLANSNLNQIR